MKNFKDMSHLELLKEFNRIVCLYDSIRDDELNFIENHPIRDMWDDEMIEEYDTICEDIESLYKELLIISNFINTL